MSEYLSYLEEVKRIAVQAGEIILPYYQTQKLGKIVEKTDHSPLTEADLASNRYIVAALERLDPAIPIISEEQSLPDYEARKTWQRFWLVDPLDGTKEFIKGKDEFTVNIALVENNEPVLGVIYIPARELRHHAVKGLGAFRVSGERIASASSLHLQTRPMDLS